LRFFNFLITYVWLKLVAKAQATRKE